VTSPRIEESAQEQSPAASETGQRGGEEEAGQVGAKGGKAQPRPHQRILKAKSFIPTVVVIALVVFVLVSSRLAGRPPQVDSITPSSGKPRDVMIITGRGFGAARNTGEVRISGISPTSSEYGEWTDTRISVTIPEEAGSGIVYVITRNGRSRGLLFINRDQIPLLASGPARPGEPYVSTPTLAGKVGELITVSGMNFGLEKGSSEVYFTWTGGGAADGGFDLADLLPARDYNLDYLSWSDREIRLRVPDGAASGNVLVTSDKGRSNSVYFELLAGAGTKFYGSPRKYSAQYALNVAVTAAGGDNTLYLWMPRVIQTPEQRKIQLVSQEPVPDLVNSGPALYSFTNLSKGSRSRIFLSWMFDRYAVETQMSPARAPPAYDTTTALYRKFTAKDPLVPSTSPEIVKASSTAVGQEKNPWYKAQRLYEWLIGQLVYSAASKDNDPVAALRQKRGDAHTCSALYCALLRAAGVPARMVAGYLAGDAGQPTQRHFWDEFYIETVGWIPVDPVLGGQKSSVQNSAGADVEAKAYYFGNLDNRHITFTKGLEEVNQVNPEGKPRRDRDLPYLLTIHEEAVGGITGYTVTFEDLQVSGTY